MCTGRFLHLCVFTCGSLTSHSLSHQYCLRVLAGKSSEELLSGPKSGYLVGRIVAVLLTTLVLCLAAEEIDASRNSWSESESVLLSCVMEAIDGKISCFVKVSFCVVLSSYVFFAEFSNPVPSVQRKVVKVKLMMDECTVEVLQSCS